MSNEKSKLLLIDAYSIICRGFYALPLLSTSNGYHTNAMLGFLNILFRTIDDEKPDYIAVAFDENAPTFRHKMYKEYKGQRKPMPSELKEQVPYVKEMLNAMKINMFSKAGYEADDILGSLANKFSSDKLEVVILSGDKDMLQLATDDIKIRLAKTAKSNSDIYPYYAKDVENEYKMTPTEFIDLKAIMGDPSDNIPGVKGVGKITANELITKYKSIDNIYKHIDEIKKPSVVKAFTEGKEEVKLYKTLVTIVKNVDIDANIEDLELKDLFNSDTYKVVEKYELKSLYKRFGKANKTLKASKKSESLLDGFVSIDNNFDDIEKNNKKYDDNDKKYAYNLKNRYKELDDSDIFNKYIPKEGMEDLTVMSYILNPIKKDYDDIYFIEQKKLYDESIKKIKNLSLEKVYRDIDLPLVKVLYNMEKLGIAVDEDLINDFGKKLTKEINKLEDKIHSLAGDDNFNINSPKQLGEILFNKLKLDYERKKGEKQSTGVEVLQKLVNKHEIIKPIMDYRTYNKLLTTYVESLPKYIVDGRIHTNFNQTETATGRLSSDNPNLQNIPIRTALGRELRRSFIPRKGFTFIDADYSQIELRILAILSEDENLINAYKGTADVHSKTASEVFGIDIKDVTPELRRKAKAINFGIVYGMSSYGLGEDLQIDTKEAKLYIDKYFNRYKKVKEYLDSTVEAARNNGFTKTYYGRIRPIPEFKVGNAMQKAFAKRVAMNSPIQGTAADIMKLAMIGVDNELEKQKLESRIVLQVHDEILIECKKGEESKVKKILKDKMTDAFDFKVKLEIEIKEGKNWDDAH
ncbi:MAG: DNA polymerase I [Lachnospiraceae bacterium]|nr:DNA polymerase I [Lachnospiraceae bacterium]